MDEQNRNLILAMVLSVAVIAVWYTLFPPPEPAAIEDGTVAEQTATVPDASVPGDVPAAAGGGTAPGTMPGTATPGAVAQFDRIPIRTDRVEGTISLLGGRIDELNLTDYLTDLDPGAEDVTLMSPLSEAGGYYALWGWSPGPGLTLEDVPGAETVWSRVSGEALSVGQDVVLRWENGSGLTFDRTMSIDEDYLITVTQSVSNGRGDPVRLAPYGMIARHGEPQDLKGFFIIHEGGIRQTGAELDELDYGDLRDPGADPRWGANADVADVPGNGWIGFTDHYWMTTLIPDAAQPFSAAFQYDAGRDIYRATALLSTQEVAAGETAQISQSLFAGAKEWEVIRDYEDSLGIYRFVDSIDWGWFYFLTKPIFQLLHWLNGVIGNMGWSIIVLTFVIKALLLPLAYKSYVSMARMKELQPKMEELKERIGDDREKMQKAMIQLYKEEKVNPAAGCLPILLQIPIFFSLYKVIFVTIELRHAPWVGWIRDLSAPDPSSLFNLWGIMPWDGPEAGSILALIFLGILPLLLGISMWLQQKLNPAPADPTQAMILNWMPWVFMFMLGSFASGLVIYWITNNVITFAQQYAIMRSQGIKPDVFGNITSSFRKKAAAQGDKPANKPGKPKGK